MSTETLHIQPATAADVATIGRLAHEIWWPTYRKLLPYGQIRMMLAKLYSDEAITQQLQSGQRFSLVLRGGAAVGFVGYQQKPSDPGVMRLEKLYVHPSEQGRGTGKQLINYVVQCALDAHCHCVELNVYQRNPARAFYERQGFTIKDTVDIPFHGYVLQDYIMRKPLLDDKA